MREAPVAPPVVAPRPPSLRGATLHSAALAVPDEEVTTATLARRLGIEEHWIVERTGIERRRIASRDLRLDELAAEASRAALDRAGVAAADLDLLLVATWTQEEMQPPAAPLVAGRIGATKAGAVDVGAACTGFLAAVAFGAAYVETGRAESVLVVGADLLSRVTDWGDPRTAPLFADGAGACVMTPAPGSAPVGEVILRADAEGASWVVCRHSDHKLRMAGHETFKHAVNRLVEVTEQAVARAGLTLDDIDLFVYHQANGRILRAVGERLALEPDRVVSCVDEFANTSAATVPIALAVAEREGRLSQGDRVLLGAFGAGFTWGGTVVEWGQAA
jgi:3-oxoacyl-[acyl-carrier-protein] synthase-3